MCARVVLVLLFLFAAACSLAPATEQHATRAGGGTFDGATTAVTSAREPDEASYRDDVRDYTYVYVDGDGDGADFEGGLDDIAQRHGVTRWRENAVTYVAIGAGLAEARASAREVDAFKRGVCRSDPSKMARLQQGFDDRR